MSAFKVPTEFYAVATDCLGQTGAEDAVFLHHSGGCERGPVVERSLIAKDAESGVAAEKVEAGARTGLRMRGAGKSRLVAVLTMNTQDKRTGRTKRGRIAETEEKIAVAKIRACGRKRVRQGERIGAVDMQICVVH